MDLEEIKFIALFLKKLGTKQIIITGYGEQLTHPHFKEAVHIFHRQHFRMSLVTNGTLIGKYPAKIFKMFSEIVISLNSLNRETYKLIRGRDKLKEVKQNINRLLSENINVTISMTLQKANYREVREMAEFCAKKGMKLILYLATSSEELKMNTKPLSKREIDFVIREVDNLKKYNVIIAPDYFKEMLRRDRTKEPIRGDVLGLFIPTLFFPTGMC